MIDYITLSAPFTGGEYIKLTEKLSVEAPINSDKVKFDYANLRVVYYPNSNKITLSNSLHKYYNLEFTELRTATNHDDFTFSKFNTVADFLSEFVLEKALTDINISSRFEFGLNLQTDLINPFDLICKYQSIASTHINEFFTVAPRRGKPIQRNCHYSDYYVKGYSKSMQAGIPDKNILRLEIVVNELRKLRSILGVEDVSLATIADLQSWNNMFRYLINTYDSIKKIPELNSSPISIEEMNAIYSYCNKLKRNDIKQSTTRYYFEQLNKGFKAVYDKYNSSPENYHNVIRQQMFETYARLTGGIGQTSTLVI